MASETQRSIFEWCELHYSGEDTRKKLQNLVEEVAELGLVLGVSADEMMRVIMITAAKSSDPVGDAGCIRKEIGDVDLSLKNLAEHIGVDAQAALEDVMAVNRTRTLAESQARRDRKAGLGLA